MLALLAACVDGPSLRGVTCAGQPGAALRWDCALERSGAGPVLVDWTADGERTLAVTTDEDVTLWGVPPDVDVDWTASDGRATVEGSFHSDPLPVPIVLSVVGEAVAEHVLFPVTCDDEPWLVVARTDGVVEWLEPTGGDVSGFGFAPPDVVLGTFDRHTFSRIHLDGRRIDQGPSILPMHHDVAADADGRTVMLTADAYDWDGQLVVLDGLSVLDPEGLPESTWSLADHAYGAVPPDDVPRGFWFDEFPGAGDWSHGNAVTVTPDGDLLVSLRWWNAVYRIAGPATPDFGTVRWVLAGPDAPFAGDLALASETGDDPTFRGQHHPLLHPDGTMTLFDNGPPSMPSRVLRYRIDEGSATLIEAIVLEQHCAILGSAYPVDDGGLLVTCADRRTAWEFAPGATESRWRMRVTCDGGPFHLNRVQPIVLPGR